MTKRVLSPASNVIQDTPRFSIGVRKTDSLNCFRQSIPSFPDEPSEQGCGSSVRVVSVGSQKHSVEVLTPKSQHGMWLFRQPRGIDLLDAELMMLQKSWYT